ncbi:hypothetical protein V8D89_006722 [Ganoderma adspersum]
MSLDTSDHLVYAQRPELQSIYDAENRDLELEMERLRDIWHSAIFDCGVCFERYQEDHIARVMPCRHSYCRPCLRSYAISKIEAQVDDIMIQHLGLNEKQYEIFSEMQMAPFSTIIHCRKCVNTMFVDKEDYQQMQEIVCPLSGCEYSWCKLCLQAIETEGPKHSCDGASELDHLMQQRGWKRCPGCQTPSEKIDGCNHMTCTVPACNAHFCYRCGKLIVQSALQEEVKDALPVAALHDNVRLHYYNNYLRSMVFNR